MWEKMAKVADTAVVVFASAVATTFVVACFWALAFFIGMV